MGDAPLDIDTIYNLIQDEFDRLDQQIGSHGQRRLAIRELPLLERDLYLIHDVVAITCNGGTRAWLSYHHDEPGWVECAEEAFIRIGYPQVGAGIKSCLATCRTGGYSMTYKDDEVPSSFIIDHEHDILRSLHRYLIAHGFSFPPSLA